MPIRLEDIEEVQILDPDHEIEGGSTGTAKLFYATLEKPGPDAKILIMFTRDSGGSNIAMCQITHDDD